MRKYETIFVVDSLLKSEEIDNIVSKYERFISANGGVIEATERWGKKRLAYEIKKRQYGYYILIRFDGPPTMIKPLEREYRLNESLLRFKTLLMPKLAIKHLTKKQGEQKEQVPTEAAAETKPAAQEEQETPTTETAAPEADDKTGEPATDTETVEAAANADQAAEENQASDVETAEKAADVSAADDEEESKEQTAE